MLDSIYRDPQTSLALNNGRHNIMLKKSHSRET